MFTAAWSRPSPMTIRLHMLTMMLLMSLVGFHPSFVRSSMHRAPLTMNPVCLLNIGLMMCMNDSSNGYWSEC